ncbi:MAG: TldD/PmbA family protein [Firmicutes bacterium]|nr:TldD/PmbA family protein [Bacillota bacterium]
MQELLSKALKRAEGLVDYCEIRFEDSQLLSIRFQGKGLDRINHDTQYGGNVRALCRGGWGFASFNNLADLDDSLQAACEQARFAGEAKQGTSQLAPVPIVNDTVIPVYTLDPRAVSLDEKVRILTHYSDLILGYDPAITSVSIIYNEKTTTLYFANSEGSYIKQEKLDIGANLGGLARRGDVTVSHGIGRGSSIGMDCILGLDADLQEACNILVQLLDAPQVQAGVYTTICDPAMAGLFVHEAFGHLSEADDIFRNPDIIKTMTLGRRLGRDILTIYDTGEYATGRGHLVYDDEGVASERTYLIKDGILVGRLHSRESAAAMGEKPTGSARAINYQHPPICRMRSTCIAPGTSTFADMIKDIELGVYAVGAHGGETNGEMFTFTAAYGYMIRNGQLAELVRDVQLMGNVFTTLANIDMVGNDAQADDSAGGCGKGEQSPLPTGSVSPHIRIQNVIIGGAR